MKQAHTFADKVAYKISQQNDDNTTTSELNIFLDAATHLRKYGFKISPREFLSFLLAIANSVASLPPYLGSSHQASAAAIVPGTQYIPELLTISSHDFSFNLNLRASTYEISSLFLNALLNADTTFVRLMEILNGIFGQSEFNGPVKLSYQIITYKNPLGKTQFALNILGYSFSTGSALASSTMFMQMGLDSGMVWFFAPSTLIANMLLIKGGTDQLVFSWTPALYNVVANYFRQERKIYPYEKQLQELKETWTKALERAHTAALQKMHSSALTDKNELEQQYQLLERGDKSKAQLLKGLDTEDTARSDTLKLLTLLIPQGASVVKVKDKDNPWIVRGVSALAVLSTLGLAGYGYVTVQGMQKLLELGSFYEAIPVGATVFSIFMTIAVRGTYETMASLYSAFRHPIETWKQRPIYMKHYFNKKYALIAGTTVAAAAYISSGPMLWLNALFTNWVLTQFGYCPNYVMTNWADAAKDTDGKPVPYGNSCINDPLVWHSFFYTFALPAMVFTILFNPYGVPGALKMIYRLITLMFGKPEEKREYRLLEFIEKMKFLVANANEAFLHGVLSNLVKISSELEEELKQQESFTDDGSKTTITFASEVSTAESYLHTHIFGKTESPITTTIIDELGENEQVQSLKAGYKAMYDDLGINSKPRKSATCFGSLWNSIARLRSSHYPTEVNESSQSLLDNDDNNDYDSRV